MIPSGRRGVTMGDKSPRAKDKTRTPKRDVKEKRRDKQEKKKAKGLIMIMTSKAITKKKTMEP
jgi:hypothetical protein